MQPCLGLPCSRCGAQLAFSLRDAGRWRYCRGCQAPIRVPPIGKPVHPRPRDNARLTKDSYLRIWVLGAVAALVLAPATWWLLQRQERAKAEDRANQAVAAQVEAARTQVARQRWDEAADLLQIALATERATDLEEARSFWTHVRREQASTMFRAAEAALANRRPAQALSLLRCYLDDRFAAERDRAAQLKEQLELVTSDEEALALLHRLSYAALTEFVRNGTLAALEGISDPDVLAIHLERLRGCLEVELQRRQEDQARRVQSIRATPAFGELQDFATLTHRRLLTQDGGGEIDYRLLARLFRELNVNGADEQQRILATLSARSLDYGEAQKISRLRANLKERFRTYKDFDKTDREIFDRLVDQEMNKLLQDLQGSLNKSPNPS